MNRVVNLNGNSAEALINEQRAIMDAADELLKALSQAIPHGRDYQTYETMDEFNIDREKSDQHRAAVMAIGKYASETGIRLHNQQRNG